MALATRDPHPSGKAYILLGLGQGEKTVDKVSPLLYQSSERVRVQLSKLTPTGSGRNDTGVNFVDPFSRGKDLDNKWEVRFLRARA